MARRPDSGRTEPTGRSARRAGSTELGEGMELSARNAGGRRSLVPTRRTFAARVAVASLGIVSMLGGSSCTVPPAGPSTQEGRPLSSELAGAVAGAAKSCPALSPPRLAGQLMAESGLDPKWRGQDGALGIAGLTDDAWLRWRPSDSAPRTDDTANVEALAHYTCDLIGQLRQERLGTDLWRLALAAHETGVDAVRASKGIPAAAEPYVDRVAAYAAWYEKVDQPPVQIEPTPSATGNPSTPKPAGSPSAPAKPSPRWHTVTVRDTAVLERNGSWRSDRLSLTLSAAGDVVLYDRGKVVWRAGTANRGATKLVFQADGHLVLYTDAMATVWSSESAGHDGAVLLLGANGRVSIVHSGQTIWSIP